MRDKVIGRVYQEVETLNKRAGTVVDGFKEEGNCTDGSCRKPAEHKMMEEAGPMLHTS